MTEFEKITPETYEKMNEEFEEEGLAFRINVPTQEQIDDWRMIDDNFRKIAVENHLEGVTKLVESADWEGPTKLNIAKNLVEKIEELLDGKAHYVECSDRTTYHNKIVIEYNHKKK